MSLKVEWATGVLAFSAVKLVSYDAVFWTDPRSGLSLLLRYFNHYRLPRLVLRWGNSYHMQHLSISPGSVDDRYLKQGSQHSCCVGGFAEATAIGKECCRLFRAGFVQWWQMAGDICRGRLQPGFPKSRICSLASGAVTPWLSRGGPSQAGPLCQLC